MTSDNVSAIGVKGGELVESTTIHYLSAQFFSFATIIIFIIIIIIIIILPPLFTISLPNYFPLPPLSPKLSNFPNFLCPDGGEGGELVESLHDQ